MPGGAAAPPWGVHPVASGGAAAMEPGPMYAACPVGLSEPEASWVSKTGPGARQRPGLPTSSTSAPQPVVHPLASEDGGLGPRRSTPVKLAAQPRALIGFGDGHPAGLAEEGSRIAVVAADVGREALGGHLRGSP